MIILKNKFICRISIFFILLYILFTPPVFAANENLNLSASAAILIDAHSGKVLYSKNAYDKAYPASITKILTAALVLENCKLDDTVVITEDAINNLEHGYVTSNLKVGEELTIEELLNILLISSANDVAIVLANHVSGSVEDFATLMNNKAKELGCLNSHFLNPNGVHYENHYSTAYDLALIGKYALQFDKFKEIVSKTSYELSPTNLTTDKTRKFYTTNDLLLDNSPNYYKYALGIKTGFTTPAGYCLISYSEKNGLPLISVVLNSGTSDDRYLDTKSLFEYGDSNYYLNRIALKGNSIQTLKIKRATNKTKKVNLILADDVAIVMDKNTSASAVSSNIKINKNLKAPIKQGDILGSIEYTLDDVTYSSNLIASHDVKYSYTPIIFISLFVIIIVLLIFYKRKKKLDKKKYKMFRL